MNDSEKSNGKKRGRKQDDSLPPSRSREIQRAFRQRRANLLNDLQAKVDRLEAENAELRSRLGMEPRPRSVSPNVKDEHSHEYMKYEEDSPLSAEPRPSTSTSQNHLNFNLPPVQRPSLERLQIPTQLQHNTNNNGSITPNTMTNLLLQLAQSQNPIHNQQQNRTNFQPQPIPFQTPPNALNINTFHPNYQLAAMFLQRYCRTTLTEPPTPFHVFLLTLLRGLEVTGKGPLHRVSWTKEEDPQPSPISKEDEEEVSDQVVSPVIKAQFANLYYIMSY